MREKYAILIIVLSVLLPLTSFASFDVSLKYGSKGQSVIDLQDFLRDQNAYTNKSDGKFGLSTLRAVEAFQTANNLEVDGYFGKSSRAKANIILATIIAPSNTAEIAETGTIAPPVIEVPILDARGCSSTSLYSSTTGISCINVIPTIQTTPTVSNSIVKPAPIVNTPQPIVQLPFIAPTATFTQNTPSQGGGGSSYIGAFSVDVKNSALSEVIGLKYHIISDTLIDKDVLLFIDGYIPCGAGGSCELHMPASFRSIPIKSTIVITKDIISPYQVVIDSIDVKDSSSGTVTTIPLNGTGPLITQSL